jgi:glucosamine-6-phosphate isomerase
MELIIEKDYVGMSLITARLIINTIKNKPRALLCLAAGDTPRLAYSLLSSLAEKENVDVSQCYFISLDEWVGIPPENEGSCQYFLRTTVFNPLKIPEHNIHLFNSLAADLHAECAMMDDFIRSKGGVDLMVVGVGRNGHIGFNEPGVPFDKYSHVVELDDTTKTIGQKYFTQHTALNKGITLGLKHLLESHTAIMIANGIKKAGVIRSALEEEISVDMPAGIIRLHKHGIVILDKDAASLLTSGKPVN